VAPHRVAGGHGTHGLLALDPPGTTPLTEIVRLAKIRWRIEHDYRELKHGLGLDHFEGRTWAGWHHHAALVTAAHRFVTAVRLASGPKAPEAA
jgi:SRSO17 transposase